MADVNIKYNGTSIATMNASGTKTCQTSGKYCEGNITVEYTDPEKPTQTKSMSLGAASPSTVTPDSGKVLSSVTPSIDTSVIKAENIAQGATILGVAGTHASGVTNVRHFTYTPTSAGSGTTPHVVVSKAELDEFRDKCSRDDFTCVAIPRSIVSTAGAIACLFQRNKAFNQMSSGYPLNGCGGRNTSSQASTFGLAVNGGHTIYNSSWYVSGWIATFNVLPNGTGGLNLYAVLEAGTTYDIYCIWEDD